jgi:hypothetical protein
MGLKMYMFLAFLVIISISNCIGPKTKKISESDSVGSAASATTEADETRKKLERDHARAQRDAMQPMLIQMCREGNSDACRQVREWENMRKY